MQFLNSKYSIEKTNRHFDRSGAKHRKAEKSVQKQISRLAFGSLEMTLCALFYRANSKFKTCPHLRAGIQNSKRKGAVLLVVLFVIMAITVLSLGFLWRSDVELACGQNMVLRAQMENLAESGLQHAKGLLLSPQDVSSTYWAGATGQQLVTAGQDYYDIEVTRDDSDPTNYCNYIIDCNAYRLRDGQKIGRSSLSGELRLDPCIAYWADSSTTVSRRITIRGDVYCAGDLSNAGIIRGDVFAASTITGTNIIGRRNESVAQAPVDWPGFDNWDFIPSYRIDSVTYSAEYVSSYVHPSGSFSPSASNPAGVRYRGSFALPGDVDIEGTLVTGNLGISGDNNVITAVKNFPALMVADDLRLLRGSLKVNGLAVVGGEILIHSGDVSLEVLGGLLVGGGIVELATDSSGGSHTLRLHGNPIWQPTAGVLGGALEFDGVYDRAEDLDADTYLNGLAAVTVSIWVKSDITNQDRGILFTRDPTGADEELGIRYDKNGAFGGGHNGIKASIRTSTGYTQIESSSYVQTTGWQHLVLVWSSGGRLKLYINGQPDMLRYAGGPLAGTISGVQKLMLGQGTKGGHWDGLVDELRIYNRALDPNDVTNLYLLGSDSNGLIAFWKFDEVGSNVTVTAEPMTAAVEVWSQPAVPDRWQQAAGAFFRSITTKKSE